MEEARSLSVETRKEGQGPKISVLLVYVPQMPCGVSALFCWFSMNGYTPMMPLYNHVICALKETRIRIVLESYNWLDVTSVDTTIASPSQPSIRISGKVETFL